MMTSRDDDDVDDTDRHFNKDDDLMKRMPQ